MLQTRPGNHLRYAKMLHSALRDRYCESNGRTAQDSVITGQDLGNANSALQGQTTINTFILPICSLDDPLIICRGLYQLQDLLVTALGRNIPYKNTMDYRWAADIANIRFTCANHGNASATAVFTAGAIPLLLLNTFKKRKGKHLYGTEIDIA